MFYRDERAVEDIEGPFAGNVDMTEDSFRELATQAMLGLPIQCAMEHNYFFARFPLAKVEERWMFNGRSAGTLEGAHAAGCEACRKARAKSSGVT